MKSGSVTQHNSHSRLHRRLIIPVDDPFFKGEVRGIIGIMCCALIELSGGVELYTQHRLFMFPACGLRMGDGPCPRAGALEI